MKVYDKAGWHIDGGEEQTEVIARFNAIFEFLRDKKMLNEEGLESLEYCMDSSISLNSGMINKDGKTFLDRYYDEVDSYQPKEIRKKLEELYKGFKNKENVKKRRRK